MQAHSVLIVKNVATYYIVDYTKIYTGTSIEKVLNRLFEAHGVTAAEWNIAVWNNDNSRYEEGEL